MLGVGVALLFLAKKGLLEFPLAEIAYTNVYVSRRESA